MDEFKVGDRIKHYSIGLGTVVAVGEGYIERSFVTIEFDELKNMVKDSTLRVPIYEIVKNS